MRVTMVASGLGTGGAELQFAQLAEGLAARGCHVKVVSMQRGGRYDARLADGGLTPVCVPVGRIPTPLAAARLHRELGRTKADLIFTQAFRANLWGRSSAIVHHVPVVASIRVSDVHVSPSGLLPA